MAVHALTVEGNRAVDGGLVRYELTDELDRVVCATAISCWRPGGPFDVDDVKQHARLAALEALPKHDGSGGLPGFVANAAGGGSTTCTGTRTSSSGTGTGRRLYGRRFAHDLDGGEPARGPATDFTDDVATRIDAASSPGSCTCSGRSTAACLTALYLVGQERSVRGRRRRDGAADRQR
jgi:hypothetical protein